MCIYRLVFRDEKCACTQLPFLNEHKSPCIYIASILPEIIFLPFYSLESDAEMFLCPQ